MTALKPLRGVVVIDDRERKIFKEGFSREGVAIGSLIRFEIIQVKGRCPSDDGPNLFFLRCLDKRNITSEA
jgi:hypothetical protein